MAIGRFNVLLLLMVLFLWCTISRIRLLKYRSCKPDDAITVFLMLWKTVTPFWRVSSPDIEAALIEAHYLFSSLWSRTDKSTLKIGTQSFTFPWVRKWVSKRANIWADERVAQYLRFDSWLLWTIVQSNKHLSVLILCSLSFSEKKETHSFIRQSDG